MHWLEMVRGGRREDKAQEKMLRSHLGRSLSFSPSLPPSLPPSLLSPAWDIFFSQWLETIRGDEGEAAAADFRAIFREMDIEGSLKVRKGGWREGAGRKGGREGGSRGTHYPGLKTPPPSLCPSLPPSLPPSVPPSLPPSFQKKARVLAHQLSSLTLLAYSSSLSAHTDAPMYGHTIGALTVEG
jgi:hypothetical protein